MADKIRFRSHLECTRRYINTISWRDLQAISGVLLESVHGTGTPLIDDSARLASGTDFETASHARRSNTGYAFKLYSKFD